MNPVNFYAAARHNYELVMVGSQHEEFKRNPDRFLLAISNCLCLSVELYFKSILHHRGIEEQKLKGFGHDICKLLEEVKKDVSVKVENIQGLEAFVSTWGPSYKEHSYRYMKENREYKTFNIAIVLKMIDHLGDFTRDAIGLPPLPTPA